MDQNKETVVTINNGSRKISMYFIIADDGGLDMQMSVLPEVKEGEEPDLPLSLASIFLEALNTTGKEDNKSEIYDGQD